MVKGTVCSDAVASAYIMGGFRGSLKGGGMTKSSSSCISVSLR